MNYDSIPEDYALEASRVVIVSVEGGDRAPNVRDRVKHSSMSDILRQSPSARVEIISAADAVRTDETESE